MGRLKSLVSLVCLIALMSTPTAFAENWQELKLRADSLWDSGAKDSGLATLQRSLEAAVAELGEADTAVAGIYHEIGECYFQYSQYDQSIDNIVRAKEIYEAALGADHRQVAICKSAEAFARLNYGDNDTAFSLYSEAIENLEADSLENDTELAEAYRGLGAYCRMIGAFTEAELYITFALEIYQAAGEDYAQQLSNTYNSLGNMYYEMKKLDAAETAYQKAAEILNSLEYVEPRTKAIGYISLGLINYEKNNFFAAKLYYDSSISIFIDAFGENCCELATPYTNLANLFGDMNDNEKAEEMHRKAIGISEICMGRESESYALDLMNYATLLSEIKRFAEADSLFTEGSAIIEKIYPEGSPTMYTIKSNIAMLKFDRKKYDEAQLIIEEILSDIENNPEASGFFIAPSIRILASVFQEKGEFGISDSLFNRADSIFRDTYGEHSHDYSTSLEQHGDLYRQNNMNRKAFEFANQALNIRSEHFRRNGSFLQDKQILNFLQYLRLSMNYFLNCCHDYGFDNSEVALSVCGNILKTKGSLFDIQLERQGILRTSDDEEINLLADSLDLVKRLYLNWVMDEESRSYYTVDEYREQANLLDEAVNYYESRLAEISSLYSLNKDYIEVDYNSVKQLLPENSALLEYMKYAYFKPGDSVGIPYYLAAVMTPDADPVVVNLGPAYLIDSLIEQYRAHINRVSELGHSPLPKDQEEYDPIAKKLYASVIKPVEDKILGRDLVFLVPDAGLHLVSFAGLKNADGIYLIEKVPVHYLSTGRDLVRLQAPRSHGHGLLAMGDPDFDADASARAEKIAVKEEIYAEGTPSGSSFGREAGKEFKKVKRLPHTQREIEEVVQLWGEKNLGGEVRKFTGVEASEDNLKANCKDMRVIHLATHGYFHGDEDFVGHDIESLIGNKRKKTVNPLVQSGLLLAGSNNLGSDAIQSGIDDGIATAYEVIDMNLEGVDMVVLSACETGLGTVETGEGVYGLRRAFQMAGARTVVSTLWSIPDSMTVEFMDIFYGGETGNFPQNIRSAQLESIDFWRTRNLPEHPFIWGAFITTGDWRYE